MNFFSPDRPRLGNGLPAYSNGWGALPSLQVIPTEQESETGGKVLLWEVGVMVPSTRRSYHWAHYYVFSPEDLTGLFQSYLEDPEKVLGEVFDVNFAEATAQKDFDLEPTGTETLSLDDLEF